MLNAANRLQPGMKVKRWVLVIVVGLTMTSLGFAYILTDIYRVQPLPEIAATITLQFIERPVRGALFILLGFTIFVLGMLRLNQSLLAAFVGKGNRSVVDAIYSYRLRERGPKVVVVGGGTGLS